MNVSAHIRGISSLLRMLTDWLGTAFAGAIIQGLAETAIASGEERRGCLTTLKGHIVVACSHRGVNGPVGVQEVDPIGCVVVWVPFVRIYTISIRSWKSVDVHRCDLQETGCCKSYEKRWHLHCGRLEEYELVLANDCRLKQSRGGVHWIAISCLTFQSFYTCTSPYCTVLADPIWTTLSHCTSFASTAVELKTMP